MAQELPPDAAQQFAAIDEAAKMARRQNQAVIESHLEAADRAIAQQAAMHVQQMARSFFRK